MKTSSMRKPVLQTSTSSSCSAPSAVDDAVSVTRAIGVGDEVDVVARQRGVVVVGDQDALAADARGRREPRAQLGVGHLAREVLGGPALEALQQGGPARDRGADRSR